MELVEASSEIGMIHECNCHYTYGLTRRIMGLGKEVEDLTVKELIALHRQYGEVFNRLYSPSPTSPARGEATEAA